MIAIVEVLERIRKKTVSFSPPLSCIIFIHRFSRFKDETEVDVNSKTFLFENCSCNRTLFDIEENKTNSVKFSQTTCGREAFQRGSNQKVVGFSFYGDSSSEAHKAREYFTGIEENLRLVRFLYGDDWSIRLYYDLDKVKYFHILRYFHILKYFPNLKYFHNLRYFSNLK